MGLDSVKSLRERLDKKLKAISETIDSISKKESKRAISSSKESDRIEFGSIEKKKRYENDFNSIDYDVSLPKFNANNNVYISNTEVRGNRFENKVDNFKSQLLNKNDNHLDDDGKNSYSNLKNDILFSIKDNKENLDKHTIDDKNSLNNINYIVNKTNQNINNLEQIENNLINKRASSINKDIKSEISVQKYENTKESMSNLNSTPLLDNDIKSRDEMIKDYQKEHLAIKSNILINDNFDVNKIENSPKQDDLYNLNFLNNTSTGAIAINPNQYNKNFIIEENFISNDPIYKNLINNEISKISHDNFNDEVDAISDNEVDDFEFKRKKYNNIAMANKLIEEKDIVININKKAEEKILGEIEELNSMQNSKSPLDKNSSEKNRIPNFNKIEKESIRELEYGNNNFNKIKKDSIEKHISNSRINQASNLLQNSKEKKGLQLRNSSNNNRFNLNNNYINNNTKEDLSVLHNVNNSLEKLEQSIRIHDENLLQKIDEVNKEKYQEALKNQEELEKIESSLSLMQRLTHEKWQIRKNAFKQISELIITLQANNKSQNEGENYDIAETMETLFPWLKYLITDTNVVALIEGLNSFCYLLDYCNNEQKNKALILFFDELEKLIMHNKNSITDLCLKVIINSASTKKFSSFTISEMIRKLNTTNNKLLMFINRAIEEMLENSGLITEHYLKLFFEKSVFYYNSTKQLNKNLEKKKIYGKIILTIFEKINDNLESIKHHLNLNQEDAASFDKLLQKADKDKKDNKNSSKINFTLYDQIPEGKNAHSTNNMNNYNSNKAKTAESNNNLFSNQGISSSKNITGNLNNNLNLKDRDNEIKNYGSNNNNVITEVVDLFNILPNEYFEIPFITALKTKKEILENVNRKLSDYINIKDREYKEILNIINYTIDDTNVLVNLEGIKFLKNFCRLTKNSSNQTKLKNLVISCFEKFKDKKTNVKLELFDLFDTILLNHIFHFEQFFAFKLQHVISQKNPIVKQNILEYIKEVFSKKDNILKGINNQITDKDDKENGNYKTPIKTEESVSRSRAKSRDFNSNLNQGNSQSKAKEALKNYDDNSLNLKEILNKNLKGKTIITFTKLLVDIIKDDSTSQVKDLSVDILLIFKNILQNENDYAAIEKYESLISSLPNFRVNMILTGRTKSQIDNTNTEREYKANLNKIKSNIQNNSRTISQQKTGRIDTSQSINKDFNNDNSNLKNKLIKNKNKINQSNTSIYEDYENEKNMKKNNLKKINSKYIINNKLSGKTNPTLKNEDSKYNENSISDHEEKNDNKNSSKNLNAKNNNQNTKSPNIKLVSKKGVKENADDNKDKLTNKKKLDFDNGNQGDKFKKINQKERDEKVKKELRDKSQNKLNLIKKTKRTNDNIKNIKAGDLSKASATEDSAYLDNSIDKFTLNKKNTKSKPIINKPKTKNNNNNDDKEKPKENQNKSKQLDLPPTSNRTDRTNLEKKMESAIEYISNLNEESIFDYTKSVIRDFLIFIKKVTTSNNDKEDLDCHFKVIIQILENIFDQMEKIAIKLDYESLNSFIPEEIFIQTFKIIITAPCFLEDFDSVLIPFMKKIRKIINNDTKFFEIYYEIMNKFICFERGSSFLQGVDSKNTFIVFYDFFLYDEPKFDDLGILNKFEPYIAKNIFFDEDEKKKYIKEFRKVIEDIKKQQINHKVLEDENWLNQQKTQKDYRSENEVLESEEDINNKSNNESLKQIEMENEENHEEDHEEVILKNYDKKFNEKDQIIVSNEDQEGSVNPKILNNNYNYKSQSYKNVLENNEKYEVDKHQRSQSNEKAFEMNLPENLDKDISKIKDSIKEKCRKLDMNIKRINNKIESDINPSHLDSNSINETNSENQNTTNHADNKDNNSDISNTQNDHQLLNRLNDYRNNMQMNKNINYNSNNDNINEINNNYNNNNFYKPKRNLEELEELEEHIDNSENRNDEIYEVHNLPKLNNFIQNKINNLPLSNRTHDMQNNNNYPLNNKSVEYQEKQALSQNRINNNLFIHKIPVSNNNQQLNIDEIKKLILKIPSIILDDSVSEISHYVSLENSFMKMNYEIKNEFMTFLTSSINNGSLIKTSSFNCFLQLLEFLLTLLIYEMKNKTNAEFDSKGIILKLQETIENILKHKNFTEIFKVLIFLLRKYLPQDFDIQIERDNLIYLKTISYLIKINLENKIKQQTSINTIEILSEINELFIMYSPANLNPNVPNLEDLDKVYKLLRLLTDEAINGSQNLVMAKLFLDNAKKSDPNKYCPIFLQYLENIINL